jgi:hypothetical protein
MNDKPISRVASLHIQAFTPHNDGSLLRRGFFYSLWRLRNVRYAFKPNGDEPFCALQ